LLFVEPGFDVLRNLRQTLSVPVHYVTAHGTDVDVSSVLNSAPMII